MKIVVIGNYPADGQQSMDRFAEMLLSGFRLKNIDASIWRPSVIFGKFCKTTNSGIGKWLGYIDKWLLFPLMIRWHRCLHPKIWYHIGDHSNSPYLAHLPPERSSITCHDVLAIRGALGHEDAYCDASRLGKFLQAWILKNLSKARFLATVSHLTMKQLRGLTSPPEGGNWVVIENSFNNDFNPMSEDEAAIHLNPLGLSDGIPFIFHIGSSLPRKNRRLLLRMTEALGSRWSGQICFAGAAMDEALNLEASELGLSARIVEVVRPEHDLLKALYSQCQAFVFPSFSEGFGWPLIEAQACGAPVIASAVEPMPEVSGGAALHADPSDPAAFAKAFDLLQDSGLKKDLIERGLLNCQRFDPRQMIESYLCLLGINIPD